VKVLFTSIGTPERAKEFAEVTEFPEANLFADPENRCYDALEFYRDLGRTFFNPATPFAMRDRFANDGAKDLQDILSRWKPWIPPKQVQGLQQGGVVCFQGTDTIYFHRDEATGAHADLTEVLDLLVVNK